MDTCQYCQKIIKDDEQTTTFHFPKKVFHLECYRQSKRKNLTPRAQWKTTPNGFCPYCQEIIKDDEEAKIFRSPKRKTCHLECYKKRPGRSWWNLLSIIELVVSLCFLIVLLIH